ncbi:MAG: toxin-antitoxin system YwqK family antitoxin [Prevotellaceae bacterium]|nr:toxin-antitoxin system YwqK family antitoxin [Prevotellaceae bacterium]
MKKVAFYVVFPVVFGFLPSATATAQAPDTVYNQVDEHGLKQGYWQKKYPNGQIAYRTLFVDDKPRGLLVRYHENGKRMALIDYFDGGNISLAQFFSSNGALIAEGRYLNEKKKQGLWKYYKNDKLAMAENYENGLLEGTSSSYYPNGKIFERKRFKNGQQEGVYEQLDEQGHLMSEAMFARGLRNGGIRYYYTNNRIRIEGQYTDNVRTGEWTFYSPTGAVERKTTYVQGFAADRDSIDKKNSDLLKSMEANKGLFVDPEDMFEE